MTLLVDMDPEMDRVTTDPAIVIIILITASPIDIDMLMVSTMRTTNRLGGIPHPKPPAQSSFQINLYNNKYPDN